MNATMKTPANDLTARPTKRNATGDPLGAWIVVDGTGREISRFPRDGKDKAEAMIARRREREDALGHTPPPEKANPAGTIQAITAKCLLDGCSTRVTLIEDTTRIPATITGSRFCTAHQLTAGTEFHSSVEWKWDGKRF